MAHIAIKGGPVAVVYYRYDSSAKNPDDVHGGNYYVHNCVALEDLFATPKDPELHTADKAAWIGHVPEWETVEHVHICGTKEHAAGAVKRCYKGSEAPKEVPADNTWRPWVWVAIHSYPYDTPNDHKFRQPIAWMEKDPKDPGNGALESFLRSSGKATLTYWHFSNPTPPPGMTGRVAKNPGDFQLKKAAFTNVDVDTIKIWCDIPFTVKTT